MKKSILLMAAMLLAGFAAQAQNYMVVNTEKIFMAIPAYVQAIESLEDLSERYQKEVDERYAEIEKMYNDYQTQKATLNEATRKVREDAIISREQEVIEYQESIFGQEGTIMKKRVELIKPIQDKVFGAITNYAQSNRYELVLDIAANPTVLYYAPSADKTEEIIKLTK
jgi:outer membrane protein